MHTYSKIIAVQEDDKPLHDSEIRRISRKRDRLKKTALKSGNQNDLKRYKYYRNKVNNKKKHAKEYFYNNLDIIVSDFQNNDKRNFWKVIRHFVKNNNSTSSILLYVQHFHPVTTNGILMTRTKLIV